MTDTPRPNDGQEGSALPTAEAVQAALQSQGIEEGAINVVLWLLEHGRARQLSQAALARLVKIDQSTLSKLFGGTYTTNLTGIVARIEKARAAHLAEQALIDRPIVDTWMLTETGLFCDAVRNNEAIGILTGRSHTGKTTALEKYTATHPRVVMMRMPAGGAAKIFAQDLAEALRVTLRGEYAQVRRNILNKFKAEADDQPRLLIIDEAHETVVGRRVQTVTLELIREIYDVTGCPVVLCATPVFATKMRDQELRRFFEQIDNRSMSRKMPDLPPMRDIKAICRAYGLPPAPTHLLDPRDTQTPDDIVQQIRTQHGLGKFVKLLRRSRKVARKHQETFEWSHVLNAFVTGASWENGDGPEDERDGKEGR